MAQKRKTTRPSTRKKSPAASRRSSTRKKTTSRNQNSTRSKSKQTPAIPTPTLWASLSLDRKLDIIGVVMVVIGLITLFGLLSVNNGWLMGNWVALLAQLFGWGVYFVPVGWMLLGGWLVLRKFDRLPQLSVERGLGLSMFFLLLLIVMHFALLPDDSENAFKMAADGLGGGYIGGSILQLLRAGLGWAGAAIALGALFLLSFALILDKSIAEMFAWITPVKLRIQDSWDDFLDRIKQRSRKSTSSMEGAAVPVFEGSAQPQGMATPQDTARSAAPSNLREPQSWVLPQIEEILDASVEIQVDDEFDRQRAQVIEETLAVFNAPASVVEINRGPTITQFGVEPNFVESRGGRTRVRVNKISALADDLALALAATRIRIEAPVPGKGFVGIEVPNDQIAMVALRDGIENRILPPFSRPAVALCSGARCGWQCGCR